MNLFYFFFLIKCCFIALYNIVGINLTKLVSSTARAVVDTVRTVFIWVFFLFIHPVPGTEENFYWLQLVGFIFLVLGNFIYNEIVELYFWNLDYNTRRNIAARALNEKDDNDTNNGDNENSLYPNTNNQNTYMGNTN